MYLVRIALIVFTVYEPCNWGAALQVYNTTQQTSVKSINNEANESKLQTFGQSQTSEQASTAHNAEVNTTEDDSGRMPRYLIFVIDYFVNLTSFKNGDPKQAIDLPESSNLIQFPYNLNMKGFVNPFNSSVLADNSGSRKAQAALSSKLAARKAEDERSEQKRSDSSLLFLIEVKKSKISC